jgi:hypothetical protein
LFWLYERAATTPRAELVGALADLDGLGPKALIALARDFDIARPLPSGKAAKDAIKGKILGRHDTAARCAHCLPFPSPPALADGFTDPAA